MVLQYFLIFLAFNIFYAAFPIHAVKALGWEIGFMGIYFSILSFMMVLVQGPVLARLGTRYQEMTLIIGGTALMVVCFLMLLSLETVVIFASAAFFAIGNGLMWPSFLSLLGQLGSKSEQGAIQGVSSSAGSFASILGLVGGGLIYSQLGAKTFLVGAIIFVVALVLFLISARSFQGEAS